MRPSLIVLLLVLSILISEAQGIRLNKEFVSVKHHKVHEAGTLIKASNYDGVGEVILCKDGQCSGNSRKLMNKISSSTSSTTTTSKNGKNGGGKVDPMTKGKSGNEQPGGGDEENFSVNSSSVSDHREAAPEGYSDLLDIAEMDYSPARRKPPIHN